MPVIPSGFAQLDFIWTGAPAGPGGAVSTMGFDFRTVLDPAATAEDIAGAFTTTVLTVLDDTLIVDSYRLRLATPTGEALFEGVLNVAGGQTGEGSPPNVSWPINKLSAFGGRAHRGRWFLPGVPDGACLETGAVATSYRNSMTTELGDWLVAIASTDAVPVILHTDPQLEPDVILALTVGPVVFTRGSRLR